MKARHFRKLRKKTKYYDVGHVSDLFGYSRFFDEFNGRVLAKNHQQAAQRYLKRNPQLEQIYCNPTTKKYCQLFVKEADAVDHVRNYHFFN